MLLRRKVSSHPVAVLMLFLALQAVLTTILAWFGSEVTGGIRRTAHLHRLPLLLRDIRSEAIYVAIAIFTIRLMAFVNKDVILSNLGLTKNKMFTGFLYGFSLQIGMLFVLIAVVPYDLKHLNSLLFQTKAGLAEVFVLYLLTGIAEEIIFRGYVFQMMELHWGSGVAIVFSSVLFGLNHLVGGGVNFITVLGDILFGGIPFAGAYLLTHRLWLPIGLHCGWDFVYSLFAGGWGYHALLPASPITEKVLAVDTAFQLGLAVVFLYVAVNKGHWRSIKASAIMTRVP